MDYNQLKVIVFQELIETIFSSSEDDSDDDDNYELWAFSESNTLSSKPLPKLHNYVELIVPQYSEIQFKSHFR